jgi:uncharacterized BrkB/YihY/UPF0761 family membrane protein
MWVFLLWWIVLLGVALTAVLQERRDALRASADSKASGLIDDAF